MENPNPSPPSGAYPETEDKLRLEIIKKLATAFEKTPSIQSDLTSSGLWAFMWLADLESVRAYAEDLIAMSHNQRNNQNRSTTYFEILRTWARGRATRDGKRKEAESKKREPVPALDNPAPSKSPRLGKNVAPADPTSGQKSLRSTPTTPGSATPATPETPSPEPIEYNRSPAISDEAKKRDSQTCVITHFKTGNQGAQICASSLGMAGQDQYDVFWQTLADFWPNDQLAKWESAIQGPNRAETVENYLTMSPDTHALWGKGKFALKPLPGGDEHSMQVEFHWLPLVDGGTGRKHLRRPPANTVGLDASSDGSRLFNAADQHCITSGEVITFTTEDPDKCPLPSYDLLEMQWVLNRLVALAGAAEEPDDEGTDIEESEEDDEVAEGEGWQSEH
ncbi:uncharacterized protein DSM5745_00982 [Aspergillus mulundensis]|uniref:Uncharacterized protein n=1 Tax=Aspergillus mulundensis TaxID=1810919 RepID=A0A3D8T539_9EURO|nr:hypothetical protein DSM5745_00982 [Aspergillus mulundensis]RDW93660.1 hypothetical protein DSM5745_00982 [Aspergillus mulundensis]